MFSFTLTQENVLFSQKLLLGEGPCWNAQRQRFYFVDIKQGIVFEASTEGVSAVLRLPLVSSITFTEDDYAVLTAGRQVLIYDRQFNYHETLADLDAEFPNNRCNDANIGPDKNLWVGTMDDNEVQRSGSLYSVNRSGDVAKRISSVGISNTLAWNHHDAQLYFADSQLGQIRVFPQNNTLCDFNSGRLFLAAGDIPGTPDGSCVDSEGYVWNARWGGAAVVRLAADGSAVGRISVPTDNVTSCCFGGPDLDEMLITTASIGLTSDQAMAQPLAGQVFLARLPFRGLAPNRMSRR